MAARPEIDAGASSPVHLPGVLAYHKVGTPEFGGTWCTARQLRSHLAALQAAGWHGVDAAAFERAACERDAPPHHVAPRRVLVTFDDAFESFATQAWPELESGGFPVLLFVVSDFVGRRSTWDLSLPGRHVPHLDWPALRDLARQGVAIGSHTATHRDLRRLDDRALEHELVGSRDAIEDALGVPVRHLSYPYGRSDDRVRAAARAAGYTLGFGMGPGSGRSLERMHWPRHGVYIIDGPGAVLDKLDAARPGHAWQRLAGRTIHACAAVAARGSG
jgi:peptidoglycan/xylan/chitin deacetylase (PgdA/CDA1 family)